MQKIWGKSYFGLNTGPMLFEGISLQQKKIPLVTLPNRFSSKATKNKKLILQKTKKSCANQNYTRQPLHYQCVTTGRYTKREQLC